MRALQGSRRGRLKVAIVGKVEIGSLPGCCLLGSLALCWCDTGEPVTGLLPLASMKGTGDYLAFSEEGDYGVPWLSISRFLGQNENVKRRVGMWNRVRMHAGLCRHHGVLPSPWKAKIPHMPYHSCFASLVSGALLLFSHCCWESARALHHRVCPVSLLPAPSLLWQ